MKEKFAMVAPDVQIEDGKGTILISSEEGETEGVMHCIYSLPLFGWRCLKEGVHISLFICYICYSVSQPKGATCDQEGAPSRTALPLSWWDRSSSGLGNSMWSVCLSNYFSIT